MNESIRTEYLLGEPEGVFKSTLQDTSLVCHCSICIDGLKNLILDSVESPAMPLIEVNMDRCCCNIGT